ncbi:MAG: glycosyltransferase, partial [Planctomycetota bacterium]
MHAVVLTHYFPPIGGPGARRMLGWVRGFAAAGARVTVVTPEADPRDPYYQPGERYDGPADVRTPSIFDPARLARGGGDEPKTAATASSERRGLAAWVRPYLLLPDQRRLANGPLVRAAHAAIGEAGDPRTVVLTSSPYNSVHLAGAALKRRLGERVSWIADFRDDWFHPVFFPFPNAAYRSYNRRLERGVLDAADGLTVVSRSTLAKIRDRNPDRPESFWRTEGPAKWRWMPNGFDPTGVEPILAAAVPPRDPSAPIRVLFSGTLWQGHSVVALVAAMDAVARRRGVRFAFCLAGRVIEPLPVTPDPDRVAIETDGWKPYEESLAATRAADLLLVHTGPEAQDIKIKVFDAAAVRR